ncbi:pectate lyase family protein [Pontibacter beigongshangensis]|uniref:pectate lyase family protein n=1 Tax=Pontibacter beigongshangensis TaxID=2574733 RepID=UPI001F504590|nr:pectate lyase [Pontibacter beigongshangensis]
MIQKNYFTSKFGTLARAALLSSAIFFSQELAAQQLAFPGAEGFGRFATGGRGGEVYRVTNLNDSGPGSFRDAVSKPNRTVVFEVGGVIRIKERIIVSSDVTIAGQTAPGDGITIYGNGLSYSNANNSITRYIRIRMGKVGDTGKDAIAIASGHDMIFDHVSVSWGRDGTFDLNGDVSDVTLQNSIISQGLHTHSTGGLVQSKGGVSILRCLYIDNHTRNPKVKGVNQFVNNVIYNWEVGGYILGGSAGRSDANIEGNYFISGPGTKSNPPFSRATETFHLYAKDNYYDANVNGKLDGAAVATADYGPVTWKEAPFDFPKVTTLTPQQAYDRVIAGVGASLQRDEVDKFLIEELKSLGTKGKTISDEMSLPMAGPGVVKGGKALADSDGDGMPDAWEKKNKLNPKDPNDGQIINKDGYSNLEKYLNSLTGKDAV